MGQDVLIVHDEAHLTPAFSDLLRSVADAQRQVHEPRPAHVIELSATQRGRDDDVLHLEPEDERDGIVVAGRATTSVFRNRTNRPVDAAIPRLHAPE